MKNIIVFLLLFLSSLSLHAQDSLIIYRTFEDYQQDKGELRTGDFEYKKEWREYKKPNKRVMELKDNTGGIPKGERKFRIYFDDMWGFRLNNVLFRIFENPKVPVCLMSEGKFCYYEDGIGHIRILLSKKEQKWETMDGDRPKRFFSENINSEVHKLPGFGQIGRKKMTKKYIRKYPELEDFFSCVKGYRYSTLRSCVEEINGESLPDRKVY